jgi:hypothetical protein
MYIVSYITALQIYNVHIHHHHHHHLKRIHLIAQRKGQEELRAKAVARQKRKVADKHVANLEQARKWHKACQLQADKCRRTNDRVSKDTKFMDTTALAAAPGFLYQRLTAVRLHDLLSRYIFILITFYLLFLLLLFSVFTFNTTWICTCIFLFLFSNVIPTGCISPSSC